MIVANPSPCLGDFLPIGLDADLVQVVRRRVDKCRVALLKLAVGFDGFSALRGVSESVPVLLSVLHRGLHKVTEQWMRIGGA